MSYDLWAFCVIAGVLCLTGLAALWIAYAVMWLGVKYLGWDKEWLK